MSIKINNDNYDTYKKVFTIIFRRHWDEHIKGILPENVNPISILEETELKSKSIAKKGLQAALNDTLSDLNEYSSQTLKEIDDELKQHGLPDLSVLFSVVRKTVNKVISTKKIKNIDQYYIIKDLLDDTTSDISEDERMALSKYLGDFEMKTTNL